MPIFSVNADLFRKTPPGGARGQIGSKFTFNVSTSNYIPNGSS